MLTRWQDMASSLIPIAMIAVWLATWCAPYVTASELPQQALYSFSGIEGIQGAEYEFKFKQTVHVGGIEKRIHSWTFERISVWSKYVPLKREGTDTADKELVFYGNIDGISGDDEQSTFSATKATYEIAVRKGRLKTISVRVLDPSTPPVNAILNRMVEAAVWSVVHPYPARAKVTLATGSKWTSWLPGRTTGLLFCLERATATPEGQVALVSVGMSAGTSTRDERTIDLTWGADGLLQQSSSRSDFKEGSGAILRRVITLERKKTESKSMGAK